MLKKFTFLVIFLALLSLPSQTKAQTFTAEQNVVIEQLRAQLIQVLLQQITMLQEQIKQLIAQQNLQAQQTEVIGAVETASKRVEEVSTGGSPETTEIYIGDPICDGSYITVPITIEGVHGGGWFQFRRGQELISGEVISGDYFNRIEHSRNVRFKNPNHEPTQNYWHVNYKAVVYDIFERTSSRPTYRSGTILDEKVGFFKLPEC